MSTDRVRSHFTEAADVLQRFLADPASIAAVDQAAAIMRLKTRQTSLEAAERAYAMTSSLSLFSYLG